MGLYFQKITGFLFQGVLPLVLSCVLLACAGGGGGSPLGAGGNFGPTQNTGVAAPEPNVVDGEQVANVEVSVSPALDGAKTEPPVMKSVQVNGKIVGSKGLPFQENYEGRILRVVDYSPQSVGMKGQYVDLKVQAGNTFSLNLQVLETAKDPAGPGPNGWCFFEMTDKNPSQPDGMARPCPAVGSDCFPVEEMITWLDLGTANNPFNDCALPM